jgi:hypothetical protein
VVVVILPPDDGHIVSNVHGRTAESAEPGGIQEGVPISQAKGGQRPVGRTFFRHPVRKFAEERHALRIRCEFNLWRIGQGLSLTRLLL